eukprot:5330034-Pleurochrysis_carterae.AAC.1
MSTRADGRTDGRAYIPTYRRRSHEQRASYGRKYARKPSKPRKLTENDGTLSRMTVRENSGKERKRCAGRREGRKQKSKQKSRVGRGHTQGHGAYS